MGGQILKVLKAEVGYNSVMSKGKATPLSATMVGNFNTLFLTYLYLAASGLSCSTQDLCCVIRGLHSGTQIPAVLHGLHSTRGQQLWHAGLVAP